MRPQPAPRTWRSGTYRGASDILSVMLRDERSFYICRVKHVVHHVYHDDSRPAPVTIEVEEIEPGDCEGMRLELS